MANDWQSALKYPTVYRPRGASYPALFIVLLITARRWFPLTSSCLFLLCRHIRSVTRSSAFSRTWRQSRGRRRKENPRCCHRDPFLASLHPTLSSPSLSPSSLACLSLLENGISAPKTRLDNPQLHSKHTTPALPSCVYTNPRPFLDPIV